MYDTLIETETLAAHLGDPDWVVVDCRFSLADPGAGERQYRLGHVPGARYFHLDRDMAGTLTPETGRHPLPSPNDFAAVLGRAGVDERTQVVAYDDASGVYAARLWWMLRWLGHRQVAVLNGGWQQWLKEKQPVSTDPPSFTGRNFIPQVAENAWVSTADVLETVRHRKHALILDARDARRFRGEVEPIDPVAGHVPGAVNLPYGENVAEDGRFRCPAELRRRYAPVLDKMIPEQVVCMCGSGVTACHNLLSMEIAGFKGARLYAGSWSEWIRDPARPVARTGSDSGQ